MNRNVAIVTTILVLVVIAGYFVWLRSKYQAPVSPAPAQEEVQATPTSIPLPTSASPSASPTKEATPATKQKTATPAGVTR